MFFATSSLFWNRINPLTTNVLHHMETTQLICIANHLTGFYMMRTLVFNEIRYYATFKVRKFESLFYKINIFTKNYHLHWAAGRANILSNYIIYIFSTLGVAFAVPFWCYFQKLQLLVVKIFEQIFCCIALLYLWAQKVSQFFKILFQIGDINIFVLRGIFFSRYVQLKSSFSDEKKHQRWNLRHTLVGKLSKINVAKYWRKIPSLAEVGALQSYS